MFNKKIVQTNSVLIIIDTLVNKLYNPENK
jgi:hypothetical protein